LNPATQGGARRDPLSGRLVVFAPGRAERPGAFPRLEPLQDPNELAECPFCAGREDRTPPETLRLPAEGAWQVRVVPNLYPAFERQEVVIHAPEHLRSIAELSGEQLAVVAEAWRARAEAARADGFAYVHALVNEGKTAGASLPHTHSQLVWLREPPPAVVGEGQMDAVTEGELVLERDGVIALCPSVSAEPYEVRVAPAERERDAFASPLLAVSLELAAEALRRLRAVEPGAPANIWLHDGPWWHIDLVPRLTVAAGMELGAGIHVNPLPPEEAAARLRS
jgi:UDPglucose--hexose-1-phosphate uridylyltransferase